MSKPQVILYGAYDRHNYGDLLFALILERFFQEQGRYTPLIAATKRSDLSAYGALPTLALKEALARTRQQPRTLLIVAGGEVLTARWESIIGYLAPRLAYYPIKLAPRLVGQRAFIAFSRWLTRVRSDLPLVLGEREVGGVRVMYNSVGGNALGSLSPRLREAAVKNLKDCTLLSVRDRETAAALKGLGVPHSLVPDSAILMSDYWPQFGRQDGPGHIAFQISAHHARHRLAGLAEQLRELHERSGLKIALLSIGKAPGHSDDAPLDRLQTILGSCAYRVDSGHIEQVMACIASARLYCGTSLHGAITALAYGVPHVALLPKQVVKLSAFVQTWSPQGCGALAEVADLATVGEWLLDHYGETERARTLAAVDALKAQVRGNLERMLALFEADRRAPLADELPAGSAPLAG